MASWLAFVGMDKAVAESEFDCVRRALVLDLYVSTCGRDRGMRKRARGEVRGIGV